ncbi:McrC family protein [Acholeplasma laidlawii]|nr:McrC family protein [Acholeplasma laidlawii]NWH10174.1 McrC family protein [Acholeplasma laidlawii]OED26800.1 restriction endonuclease [Acholeplasma laidlawii]OED28743.1 restriction endonuclease [Acholeplasma laidlawii]OWU88002.1 restriction endonuclease [Acholeplasma laidlawii]RED20339.1 5-methylcytosine-specific restriction enzyme subunit McrC [Acholeplasma laidlawii]
MKKPLIVREYDEIINLDNKKDGMIVKTLPSDTFDNLKLFIEEFNTEMHEADALDFMRVGYKRNYGDVITIRNYVGLIQMNDGTQIEVLPKLSFEGEYETIAKQVFIKMLRSLKEFSGKVFNSASLNVDRMNLYEIFISMYIQEVRHLVKTGIKSFYETKEDNLKVYKGKLKVKEQQRYNNVHKERFFVAYDEYTTNRPENRLIKSTLLKLQKLSNYIENVKEIQNLLNSFELIEPSTNFDSDFSKVTINRGNKEYETIMIWSKVFLYNRSFTTFSGSTTARALLFPMEKIFESYVASELKKHLRDKDWSISTQDKGFYLFDEPSKFSLRPDIVITKENDETIILDTKWKILIDDERKNYGVSQADMYQMYAYAKKYESKKVFVIYPLNPEMSKYAIDGIEFRSEGISVQLLFIDLLNVDDSLKYITDKMI